jgi:hypothetical protein
MDRYTSRHPTRQTDTPDSRPPLTFPCLFARAQFETTRRLQSVYNVLGAWTQVLDIMMGADAGMGNADEFTDAVDGLEEHLGARRGTSESEASSYFAWGSVDGA